ncbi:helix-turn-helix transcriptional regulator [uncultured Desulfovibrio sp.]|uniref:helix-turn-helix domain-containing protein n=1 Tax=uncultured Desulfovibrio sp. TaxID=167968 RepID=UPI0025E211C3|nr:helix-turn-helix transcriptional regulator [uncultured Desulfovibrio sp.]
MSTGETRAYEALTAVLKRTRKQCGLTQVALAARLDKPQSYVSKYESGERRLDIIEFFTIAQKMEVDPVAMLREAGLLD